MKNPALLLTLLPILILAGCITTPLPEVLEEKKTLIFSGMELQEFTYLTENYEKYKSSSNSLCDPVSDIFGDETQFFAQNESHNEDKFRQYMLKNNRDELEVDELIVQLNTLLEISSGDTYQTALTNICHVFLETYFVFSNNGPSDSFAIWKEGQLQLFPLHETSFRLITPKAIDGKTLIGSIDTDLPFLTWRFHTLDSDTMTSELIESCVYSSEQSPKLQCKKEYKP